MILSYQNFKLICGLKDIQENGREQCNTLRQTENAR